MTNDDLLYRTGDSTQRPAVTCTGRESGREWIYIYMLVGALCYAAEAYSTGDNYAPIKVRETGEESGFSEGMQASWGGGGRTG